MCPKRFVENYIVIYVRRNRSKTRDLRGETRRSTVCRRRRSSAWHRSRLSISAAFPVRDLYPGTRRQELLSNVCRSPQASVWLVEYLDRVMFQIGKVGNATFAFCFLHLLANARENFTQHAQTLVHLLLSLAPGKADAGKITVFGKSISHRPKAIFDLLQINAGPI